VVLSEVGATACGTLVQLNVSPGGMPKLPVLFARVTAEGVAGDWQKNRTYHGGPNRAVCLYSEELYAWLRAEHGIDLVNGAVGENFTTRGIDLHALNQGDRLKVGECTIELTSVRAPCRNLNKWDGRLLSVIQGRSGWVAKVVQDGLVRPGDPIEVVPAGVPASAGMSSSKCE
jgi:MOSC domain-containing protein YiiM